jgi:hypothetical protein
MFSIKYIILGIIMTFILIVIIMVLADILFPCALPFDAFGGHWGCA